MFVAECVLADGSFEERVSIEEVNLSSSVVHTELKVLFQTGLEVIQLVYLFTNFLLLLLEYFLEVLLVLFFLPLYQFLQLFELLSYELLMYLICLFDPSLVSLANRQIFIDLFDPLPGFCLELRILFGNGAEGVSDAAYIVILLLLHVAIHALHAHHQRLLLTVEH